MTRLGVDLGGTNLRIAVLDDTHTVVEQRKEPVGEPRDPGTIIERLAAHAEQLAPTGPATLGVGLAAMMRDRAGTVARSPHLRWDDVAFGALLAARLGSRFSIGVYNDVNAVVWGEAVRGAARGCRDVLGVYVGTGIGAGLIANGQLVEGATHCAGELGHVKVRWDDAALPCACGQRGCVETHVGGIYVQRRIRDELGAGASAFTVGLAGAVDAVHAGHVDQAAGQGDAWALGLWSDVAPLLAVALGNALSLLNPERLILGGGLLGRTPTLFAMVEASLPLVAPPAITERLTVVPAELGDDAGLVGAAALAASGASIAG